MIPFKSSKIQDFLKILVGKNKNIKLDDRSNEILKLGISKSDNKIGFKFSGMVIAYIIFLISIPTLEILFLKFFLGEFSWSQKLLQKDFYFTLLPFLFLAPVIPFVFIKRIREKEYIEGFKFVFSQINLFQKGKIPLKLVIVFATGAILWGMVAHVNNFFDFFQSPKVVKSEIIKIDDIKEREKSVSITFKLQSTGDKKWQVNIYPKEKDGPDQFRKVYIFKTYPIDLYCTAKSEKILKIESSETKEKLYEY